MVSEQFDPSGVLPPFPPSSFGFAPAIPTPLLSLRFDSQQIPSRCPVSTSDPSMVTAPYCFPHPSAATYPPLFSSDPAPAPGFFPTPSYESSPGASHGRPPDPNHHTHASAFAFPDLWSTPSTRVTPHDRDVLHLCSRLCSTQPADGPVLLRPELADPALSSPPPSYQYAASYPHPLPVYAPVPASPTPIILHPPPPPAPDQVPGAPLPTDLHNSPFPRFPMASIIRTHSQERIAAAAEEAALLAAAQRQQQAELEEEISGHLPREVLKIQKRMEWQQNSMDLLNNNISNLTELVTQISINMGAQPVNNNAPTATSSPPTPEATPPHYQPNLSPIPERAAPTNSSASTAGSVRPLRFGNLSPRQLPHPDFPATSQFPTQASMPPKSQPLAIPSSSATCTLGHLSGSTTAPAPSCSPATTASTHAFGFTPSSTKLTSVVATVPSATEYANQVFGEMATPRSCPRAYGTTLNHYHGQGTPIQSTCVQGDSTNLSKQNLDGIQQAYGLHNLNRHSVFLADGSEHSYFALPENYPLEPAVPEPVFDIYDDETEDCSNVFVAVPASPPEQQPSEEEQEEGEKLHKCFSKALETEETNACLSYISAVCDCTLEQQQHNGEMASVNVQQLRAPRLNLLEIDESIGVFASNPRQQPYVAGQQADVQDFLIQLQPQDNERALNCPVFQASDSIVTSSNQASIEHSMKALVWLQSPLFSHLHNQLQRSNTFSVWDPGILNQLDMMLDKIALVHLVHHILTCELFSFIRQPADLKPFWTQFPFQYYSWYNATNALLEGLYVHMIQIVDCMGSARCLPLKYQPMLLATLNLPCLPQDIIVSIYTRLPIGLAQHLMAPPQLNMHTPWTSLLTNGSSISKVSKVTVQCLHRTIFRFWK